VRQLGAAPSLRFERAGVGPVVDTEELRRAMSLVNIFVKTATPSLKNTDPLPRVPNGKSFDDGP